MVYAVLFSLTLQNEADEKTFLRVFKMLYDRANNLEPGTLTYELHHVFEKGAIVPLQYLVLERYINQEACNAVHNKNPHLADLLVALEKEMTAPPTFTLHTYDNVASEAALRQGLPTPLPTLKPNDDNPMDALLQKGVLVFCGARMGKHASYATEAEALGEYIASTLQRPLVYGGGTVGIMGVVAKAVKARQGRVVTIIPEALKPRETSGDMLGDLIYTTETMSERKSIMFAHADTVVALPGGVGTFDELLEVITLYQLNAYRPKIGIVNVGNFFEPFLGLVKHLIEEGFVEASLLDMLVVRPTAVELMEALKEMELPKSSTKSLVWNHRP